MLLQNIFQTFIIGLSFLLLCLEEVSIICVCECGVSNFVGLCDLVKIMDLRCERVGISLSSTLKIVVYGIIACW